MYVHATLPVEIFRLLHEVIENVYDVSVEFEQDLTIFKRFYYQLYRENFSFNYRFNTYK